MNSLVKPNSHVSCETVLKVVCGPYINDFATQQMILTKWTNKVKELSEK